MTADTREPVLIITDIGRDIDDTIALMVASQTCHIVGVVTCGGAGQKRAASAAHFLKYAGLDVSKVPICIGDTDAEYSDTSALGCSMAVTS